VNWSSCSRETATGRSRVRVANRERSCGRPSEEALGAAAAEDEEKLSDGGTPPGAAYGSRDWGEGERGFASGIDKKKAPHSKMWKGWAGRVSGSSHLSCARAWAPVDRPPPRLRRRRGPPPRTPRPPRRPPHRHRHRHRRRRRRRAGPLAGGTSPPPRRCKRLVWYDHGRTR